MTTARAITKTAIALFLAWGASWALSFVHLGAWSLPIALAIATLKAALVVLVFMELLHVRTSIRLTAVAAVAMLGLLVGLVLLDVAERGR